jgi:hypothetical protein
MNLIYETLHLKLSSVNKLFCIKILQAFAQAGHTWTAALCALDSDGDGKTNGEELGDPTCVWTQGATPTGAATGHPGNYHSLILFYSTKKHILWKIRSYSKLNNNRIRNKHVLISRQNIFVWQHKHCLNA